MKQHNAIDTVCDVLKQDNNVQAIYLKGSFAQGLEDMHSDVDMYCIVDEDHLDDFLSKRIAYLESYRPIIYWSEANFVGPQIVAVFNDRLHFDLYTQTLKNLSMVDEIKILYDPHDLLKDYSAQPLSLTSADIVSLIHEFAFILLEFEAAYLRRDLLWASRLASHLSGELSIILRHTVQPHRAQLGLKKLTKVISDKHYVQLFTALDLCGPSDLPKGVIELLDCFEDVINTLPTEIIKDINMEFVHFMSNKIRHLPQIQSINDEDVRNL